ncbi:MAG TPA: malate synthase A, partial [Jatrophihabitans sp.]|nr:malate synthase A [Jatrophihabitans sp.]
ERVDVTADQLLDLAATPGTRTAEGLRNAVAVALRYIGAWLGGTGAVAIFNLMEDAATAEIARSQVWQWLHNDVVLDTGEKVDRDLVQRVVEEEYSAVLSEVGDPHGYYAEARQLFERVALDDNYVDFLTVAAYDLVT